MIWVDWVIIGIVGFSVLISMVRGFIKEALSLVIWVVAIIVASLFYLSTAPLLEGLIDTPSLRAAVAWLLLFLIVLVMGAIINFLLGQLIEATGLSGTDRLLGAVFGILRGVILVMVVVIFLPEILPVEQDNWWRESKLIPWFLQFEDVAVNYGKVIYEFFKGLFPG